MKMIEKLKVKMRVAKILRQVRENTSSVSIDDMELLNKQGIYPVIHSGNIVGFTNDGGQPITV